MITIAGLLLELVGFSFLACDAFKLRKFNEDTSKLGDILMRMVPNNATIQFGTAIHLNVLNSQLAIIFGAQQRIESGTAPENELAARDEAIRMMFDYLNNMPPTEELAELQRGAQANARELGTLIPRINAHRGTFIKYAIIGTFLVVVGGVLQVAAQLLAG